MNEVYKIRSEALTALSAETQGAVNENNLTSAVCAALQDMAAGGFGQAYIPAGIATDGELAIRAGYTDTGVEVRLNSLLLTEVAND